MILVDTPVWIDFFRQSDPVINEILPGFLEDGEVLAISAVFGELLWSLDRKSLNAFSGI